MSAQEDTMNMPAEDEIIIEPIDPTISFDEPIDEPAAEETPTDTAKVVYQSLDTESKAQVITTTLLGLIWIGLGIAC